MWKTWIVINLHAQVKYCPWWTNFQETHSRLSVLCLDFLRPITSTAVKDADIRQNFAYTLNRGMGFKCTDFHEALRVIMFTPYFLTLLTSSTYFTYLLTSSTYFTYLITHLLPLLTSLTYFLYLLHLLPLLTSLTYSLTYFLYLLHLLNYSLTYFLYLLHLLTYSLTYFTYFLYLLHLLTYSLTYLLTSSTYFNYLLTHLLTSATYFTYLLTYCMQQGPSWEANRSSATQEIPRLSWNPKVHYSIHKCQPPVPTPVHAYHTKLRLKGLRSVENKDKISFTPVD